MAEQQIDKIIQKIISDINSIRPNFRRKRLSSLNAPPPKVRKWKGTFNVFESCDGQTYELERCEDRETQSSASNSRPNTAEKILTIPAGVPRQSSASRNFDFISTIRSNPVCLESFLYNLDVRYDKIQERNQNISKSREINDFPKIKEAQKKVIKRVMCANNAEEKTMKDDVIIKKFNLEVKRSDIRTLQWHPIRSWLNDVVINFYMQLIVERAEQRSGDQNYPKVHAMNTHFVDRLCGDKNGYNYEAVKKWTRNVDVFSFDIILIPVHVEGTHWCMAIINFKEKTIKYYDSKGGENDNVLWALRQYLREEHRRTKNNEMLDLIQNTENVTDSPQQDNDDDCGVFSCMTAEFICRNRSLTFNQSDMNYFREKIVFEISKGKLLL